MKAKQAIRTAFQAQIEGRGFTLVEVLSSCPTNWGLSPREALAWVSTNMIPYYPLGVKKELGQGLEQGLRLGLGPEKELREGVAHA